MSQSDLSATSIGFLVFMLIISLTGSVLNASIIIVYIRSFRHIASLYFITILAIINFFISVVAIPFVIYTELNPTGINSSLVCGFSYFLRHFLALLSVFVLLFIAYERLNVIRARTVKRLKIVEKNLIYNSRKLILASAIFSLIYASFCFYLYEKNSSSDAENTNCKPESNVFATVYENLTICIGLIVYASMTYFYVRAYWIVYKSVKRCNRIGSRRNEQGETSQTDDETNKTNQKKLRNHYETNDEQHSYNNNNNNGETQEFQKAKVFLVSRSYQANKLSNNSNNNGIRQNLSIISNVSFKRKDWHVAKIFIMVTVSFLITWMPYVLASFISFEREKSIVYMFVSNTYFLNSVINPIIYSFMSKTFRADFVNMCCKKKSAIKIYRNI